MKKETMGEEPIEELTEKTENEYTEIPEKTKKEINMTRKLRVYLTNYWRIWTRIKEEFYFPKEKKATQVN